MADESKNASAGGGASGDAKHPQLNDDSASPIAPDDFALLGVAGDDAEDDPPAPETGLHALGQLGTGVLVVCTIVVIVLVVAGVVGWIFR
jgi:hypothetical protein